MISEPGLRFWLRHAQSEGGLCEDRGDTALAVLPAGLQALYEMPEEVVVTADPDAAREDGAVLLIPGHPALERAASQTLDRGDVGHAWAPWGSPSQPAGELLLQRARERFPVAHGRIDADGDAAPAYVPLLRVGLLATYALSLERRVQEREELWVEGRSGLALDESARRAIAGRPLLGAPDAGHPQRLADLDRAVRAAHALALERVLRRRSALAVEVEGSRREEAARARAYYDATLASIARRGESADAERRELLDARAAATRAERERRLREIDEQSRPRHEIRPFRLHVVWAPALELPVRIRRGTRTHPFTLSWLLGGAATFLAVRCPACWACEPLVAGRDRLGCRACLGGGEPRRGR